MHKLMVYLFCTHSGVLLLSLSRLSYLYNARIKSLLLFIFRLKNILSNCTKQCLYQLL